MYFKRREHPNSWYSLLSDTKRKTGCSRVIGEWCLEMLRKSFEVMSKFLELGVGHSAVNQWKTHGVGSILKAAVTAWRRAARRPPESRGKMSLTLETTTAEHQRFDAARDVPLLIPAWWASRIRWFSAARKSNGRSRGLKRLGRTRPRLPDLIFQSGRPDRGDSLRHLKTKILIRDLQFRRGEDQGMNRVSLCWREAF